MYESALSLFREACGLTSPLTLVCQDSRRADESATESQFSDPFVLIGRDIQLDLVLDDPRISRRHAFLQAIEGQLHCLDLDSRTKTYWDDEITPRARGCLHPGQTLKVGPFGIRSTLDRHPLANSSLAPLSPSPGFRPESVAPPLSEVALELPIRSNRVESLWPLESSLVLIGRSSPCELVLSDSSVSRFHACLINSSFGLWAVDLLAREGVMVNGQRVRWAWLDDGDTLKIGQFGFVVRYQSRHRQIARGDVPLAAGVRPSESGRAIVGSTDSSRSLGSRGTLLARRAKVRSSPPSIPLTRMSTVSAPENSVSLQNALWEPIIPGPANQLALWQQQIQVMESFHKDMILMVQMFVAMHREHVVSVRDELDRVQQLTRELSELQRESGGQAQWSGAVEASSRCTNVDQARQFAYDSWRVRSPWGTGCHAVDSSLIHPGNPGIG